MSIEEGIINPKIFLALISSGVSVMVLILVPPIAQDPGFHNFSDQKKFIGIPHFWNVMTNIPFLALGIMGLVKIHKHKLQGMLPDLYKAYIAFFTGLILIGLGSGYYHLDPSNSTLVWDRMQLQFLLCRFLY